jgi:hypothetical protein
MGILEQKNIIAVASPARAMGRIKRVASLVITSRSTTENAVCYGIYETRGQIVKASSEANPGWQSKSTVGQPYAANHRER